MTRLPNDPKLIANRKATIYSEAPFHPHNDLRTWRSTVVIAPHPDDESLGCGGLIATLTDRGQCVRVVFVSDGSMSHADSRKYPKQARIELREQEAITACHILGVAGDRVHFMRLPDTAVPRQWQDHFAATAQVLGQLLEEWDVDTLMVPWRRDPHGDHRGSWELCHTAVRAHANRIRWIEYPVWMWEATAAVDLPKPDEMIVWRLDISQQLDRKLQAIDAHASQYAGLIDDDPNGFQLQEGMLDHFRRPAEVFFEEASKRHTSLTGNYFDAVYKDASDPWNFESSAYEKAKYDATLAALPQTRYESGFEIGCSIGVLTARLAQRCDRLLAIDTSLAPLAKARARLSDQDHVRFVQMVVPDRYPDESFDLVVLSEVGYYWSVEDLHTAIGYIQRSIEAGGTLILVHYTPYVPDYPLTGDEVHEAFMHKLSGFHHLRADRTDRYRLDVWKRKG